MIGGPPDALPECDPSRAATCPSGNATTATLIGVLISLAVVIGLMIAHHETMRVEPAPVVVVEPKNT